MNTNAKGITFVPANSKRGRQIASASPHVRLHVVGAIPKNIRDWNAEVEEKNLQKAQRKASKKLKATNEKR